MLAVNLPGLKLDNPFIVGACPSTRDAEHIIRAAQLGWAGAVIKTLTSNPPYKQNPTPFLAPIKSKRKIIGLFNNESYTDPPLNEWCETIIPQIVKSKPASFVLLGSVMEDPSPQSWVKTCAMLEKAGVDAIELNVSCPHGTPDKFMGKFIGDDADLVYTVLKAVRAAIDIPLSIKLSAETLNIDQTAKACEDGGAQYIATTNTILAVSGIDINTFVPLPSYNGLSSYTGYSGQGIRPLALRAVTSIAQSCNLPVIGVGGIDTWEHVAEFMLCGASAVQVATATMLRGLEIVNKLKQGLEEYLSNKGETVTSIKGKSLPFLVDTSKLLDTDSIYKADVDMSACIRCNDCVVSCRDGAADCITLDKDLIIDRQKCTGCGLCVLICPVDALHMLPE